MVRMVRACSRKQKMSNLNVETVTGVRHWNDTLFSLSLIHI